MKQMVIQCCHIEWRQDGSRWFVKAGMLFRTIPIWPHNSAPYFTAGCWSLMDFTGIKAFATKPTQHSALTLLVSAKLQIVGYPMQLPRCNNGSAIQLHMLNHYQSEDDNFLGWILTTKGKWAHSYKPCSKQQSNKWNHPGSPVERQWIMDNVAYDIHGVVLHNVIPQRQMVNVAYYYNFLENHLHQTLRTNIGTC